MTTMLLSVGPVNSLGYKSVTIMLFSLGPVNSLVYKSVTIMLLSVGPVNSLGYRLVSITLLCVCQYVTEEKSECWFLKKKIIQYIITAMTYNIGKIHLTQYNCPSKRYHDKKTILYNNMHCKQSKLKYYRHIYFSTFESKNTINFLVLQSK